MCRTLQRPAGCSFYSVRFFYRHEQEIKNQNKHWSRPCSRTPLHPVTTHSFFTNLVLPVTLLLYLNLFILFVYLKEKKKKNCLSLLAETPVKNSSKSPCCLTSGQRWTPAVANKLNLLFFFSSPASISVLQTFTARRWQCDRIVCLCLLERVLGLTGPWLSFRPTMSWLRGANDRARKRALNIKLHMVAERRASGWT